MRDAGGVDAEACDLAAGGSRGAKGIHDLAGKSRARQVGIMCYEYAAVIDHRHGSGVCVLCLRRPQTADISGTNVETVPMSVLSVSLIAHNNDKF